MLPSVKQVKPKKWRILVLADVISMTTGPLFSCELPLTNRDPNQCDQIWHNYASLAQFDNFVTRVSIIKNLA